MTTKKRVVMPRVKPGNVVACEHQGDNHFSLVRLQPAPPPAKKAKAEVRRAIKNSKLLLDVTWDELRALTREP